MKAIYRVQKNCNTCFGTLSLHCRKTWYYTARHISIAVADKVDIGTDESSRLCEPHHVLPHVLASGRSTVFDLHSNAFLSKARPAHLQRAKRSPCETCFGFFSCHGRRGTVIDPLTMHGSRFASARVSSGISLVRGHLTIWVISMMKRLLVTN